MKKLKIFALALILLAGAAHMSEAALSHEQARRVWNRVAVPTGLTELPFSIQNEEAGLSLASAILGNILGDGLAGVAVNIGANLVNSGWSREQEIAADDYSVELAYSQGEDPVGMYSAIKKLSSVSKTQPSGFNSHPPDDRRMLHIRNKILALDPNAQFPD